MASMQERLNKANINRSRKLFDRHIKRLGTESEVIRIRKVKTSIRGDYDLQPISSGKITMYIEFPPEMPLLRSRTTMVNAADPTQVSFWDLLPIFGYVKWADNVVEGDFLIHVFYDENNKKVPLVLRVVNEVGSFNTYLNWRKIILAVHNATEGTEIQSVIDTYISTGTAP